MNHRDRQCRANLIIEIVGGNTGNRDIVGPKGGQYAAGFKQSRNRIVGLSGIKNVAGAIRDLWMTVNQDLYMILIGHGVGHPNDLLIKTGGRQWSETADYAQYLSRSRLPRHGRVSGVAGYKDGSQTWLL